MPTPPARCLPRCLLGALALLLAAAAAAQVSSLPRWTPFAELPRTPVAAVYDRARDRIVAFGSYATVLAEPIRAFEWNGRWQAHQQATASQLTSLLGAVYDRTHDEVLLVGYVGFSTLTLQNEVYRAGRFRSIQGVPMVRGVAFVHDDARGEVLAYGGAGGSYSVVDTLWRWNGSTWSVVSQPAVRPPGRMGAALVFDPLRGVVVLFGGGDGFGNPRGDTWTWDGQAWQQVATTGPAPREAAGFVFDQVSGTCLLHGGYVRDQEVAGTWSWDGSTWTQFTAPGAPGAGWLVGTAGRPLLVRENAASANGTWSWNGTSFVLVAAPQNTIARYETRLAYDSARGELAVFGGQPIAGGLWLWNGAWRQVGLPPGSPPARRNHGMVYDAARQQLVLFGGRDADVGGRTLGDTWTWDGASWTQRQPLNSPPPRIEPGFVYDSARQQCLLFGGFTFQNLADTWTWDGANWTQRQPAASPSGRYSPDLADDELRQRVVLINGLNNSATPPRDTWEWDGATWLQRTPQVQVSGPLVYDRLLGRVLVVTSYGAIHSWNGSEWEPIAVYAPIDQRPSPMSLAWHDGLGRVVSLTSNSPTLWSLALRPAQLEALGAPCPSGSGNDCDLLALGRPRLGNDRFELDLRGGVANTYGAVVLGLTPGATLLPGGCTLQVDTVVASELLWLGAGGYGRVRLPIPAATMLVGVAIYVQGFALDGTGPLQGVSVAPGLRLQVGF